VSGTVAAAPAAAKETDPHAVQFQQQLISLGLSAEDQQAIKSAVAPMLKQMRQLDLASARCSATLSAHMVGSSELSVSSTLQECEELVRKCEARLPGLQSKKEGTRTLLQQLEATHAQVLEPAVELLRQDEPDLDELHRLRLVPPLSDALGRLQAKLAQLEHGAKQLQQRLDAPTARQDALRQTLRNHADVLDRHQHRASELNARAAQLHQQLESAKPTPSRPRKEASRPDQRLGQPEASSADDQLATLRRALLAREPPTPPPAPAPEIAPPLAEPQHAHHGLNRSTLGLGSSLGLPGTKVGAAEAPEAKQAEAGASESPASSAKPAEKVDLTTPFARAPSAAHFGPPGGTSGSPFAFATSGGSTAGGPLAEVKAGAVPSFSGVGAGLGGSGAGLGGLSKLGGASTKARSPLSGTPGLELFAAATAPPIPAPPASATPAPVTPSATPADENKNTALHKAAKSGDLEVVKREISSGVDLNPANKTGITPLIFAASAGHIGAVQALLEAGADRTLTTHKGLTALQAARNKLTKAPSPAEQAPFQQIMKLLSAPPDATTESATAHSNAGLATTGQATANAFGSLFGAAAHAAPAPTFGAPGPPSVQQAMLPPLVSSSSVAPFKASGPTTSDGIRGGPTAVFSYGSNGVAQLRSRCQNPTLTSVPATLPGFVRCFGGSSEKWGGAIASVLEAEGSTCYGSVAHLSEAELALLDGFEGVNEADPTSGVYRRQNVTCSLKDGTKQSAIMYVKNDLTWSGPPSEAYLAACLTHLTEQWPETRSIEVRDGTGQLKMSYPVPSQPALQISTATAPASLFSPSAATAALSPAVPPPVVSSAAAPAAAPLFTPSLAGVSAPFTASATSAPTPTTPAAAPAGATPTLSPPFIAAPAARKPAPSKSGEHCATIGLDSGESPIEQRLKWYSANRPPTSAPSVIFAGHPPAAVAAPPPSLAAMPAVTQSAAPPLPFGALPVPAPAAAPPAAALHAATGCALAASLAPPNPDAFSFGGLSFGDPGGGAMGATTTSSPFGAPAPAAPFGSPTAQPATPSAFGASLASPTSSPANTAASNPFGAPAAPASAFGGSPFGAPAATNVFGAAPAPAPSVFGSFGGSPAPAFGSAPAPAFGSAPAAAFGSPPAPVFGGGGATAPAFGAPSALGGAATTPAFGAPSALGAGATVGVHALQRRLFRCAAFAMADTAPHFLDYSGFRADLDVRQRARIRPAIELWRWRWRVRHQHWLRGLRQHRCSGHRRVWWCTQRAYSFWRFARRRRVRGCCRFRRRLRRAGPAARGWVQHAAHPTEHSIQRFPWIVRCRQRLDCMRRVVWLGLRREPRSAISCTVLACLDPTLPRHPLPHTRDADRTAPALAGPRPLTD